MIDIKPFEDHLKQIDEKIELQSRHGGVSGVSDDLFTAKSIALLALSNIAEPMYILNAEASEKKDSIVEGIIPKIPSVKAVGKVRWWR